MEREQILDLYEWRDGVCFRHPSKGLVPTTVVGAVHPRADGEHEVRGCEDCVIAMEGIRREESARAGWAYEPGHLGKCSG